MNLNPLEATLIGIIFILLIILYGEFSWNIWKERLEKMWETRKVRHEERKKMLAEMRKASGMFNPQEIQNKIRAGEIKPTPPEENDDLPF